MTREQITRAFEVFGTIIPASSQDIRGRRTAYFYRKQAIAWACLARRRWLPGGGEMRETFRYLAKHYLATYRQLKS